jgi:polar amino acid transport system ATP-binding protein
MSESHTLLKVDRLHKTYGTTIAIADATLEVFSSQQVAIIGASGSGKSTLLRCINFLETPTQGTVWLDGQYIGGHFDDRGTWVSDTPAQLVRKRRDIGMVFQGFHLFHHLSALDNVAIGPQRVLRRPLPECRDWARHLLSKVHLNDHADKFPWQLSGGQQQRVAIARALAMNPKLILFDEPTSALDPRLTQEVLQVMQDLAAEGMTMLVVTHEIGFARKIADTVVFMDGGRIIEVGPASRVLVEPEQQLTREFFSYVW